MQHSPRAWSLSRASPPSAAASTLSAARLNAAAVPGSGDCASRAADGLAPWAVMPQPRAGAADGSCLDPSTERQVTTGQCRSSVCLCHPLLTGCIAVRSASSAVTTA